MGYIGGKTMIVGTLRGTLGTRSDEAFSLSLWQFTRAS